jgi:hypothetical protein
LPFEFAQLGGRLLALMPPPFREVAHRLRVMPRQQSLVGPHARLQRPASPAQVDLAIEILGQPGIPRQVALRERPGDRLVILAQRVTQQPLEIGQDRRPFEALCVLLHSNSNDEVG